MAKKTSPLKGRMKTPPWPDHPEWSTSKFFGFLRSGLRAAYNKYPPKWEVLKEASRPYRGSDKRKKTEYQCKQCQQWFSGKDVSVDHIIPAGSLLSYDDLTDFSRKLFCSKEGLRVVCNTCHAQITASQKRGNPRLEYPREESSWRNMISRCHNPNSTGYHRYGGRGIKVCESWRDSFWQFLEDMGDRPDGTSLDRIDTDGNYEPSNCRWATWDTQANNKNDNVLIEHDGEVKTITQWARQLGMRANTLQYRLYRGWSIPQALGFEERVIPSKKMLQGELLAYVKEQLSEGRSQSDIAREIGIDSSAISRAMTAEERSKKDE